MTFKLIEGMKKGLVVAVGAVVAVLSMAPFAPQAMAHGERAQEPFLRMRSVQWYDVKWSKDRIKVNEEMAITGKFRMFPDWPNALAKPERSFLNITTPGPVFHRVYSSVGGQIQFFSGPLELGKNYEFKVVLRGRMPGDFHVHTQVNMEENGPVAGPGSWVKVTGNADSYKNMIKLVTGPTVNMDDFGLVNGIVWHVIYLLFAVAWILYWLVQPLFLARYRALANGAEDVLVTPLHMKIGGGFLVASFLLIFVGYQVATSNHPHVIPLQAGKANFLPLETPPVPVTIKVLRSEYDVPGRAMRVEAEITNTGDVPLVMAEFSTAGVRFLNPESGIPLDNPAYPKEMLATSGLKVDNNAPLEPGETRKYKIAAADAIWELQRLVDLVNDPDSRFGGLLFFYDPEGTRYIADISGPIIPVFRALGD